MHILERLIRLLAIALLLVFGSACSKKYVPPKKKPCPIGADHLCKTGMIDGWIAESIVTFGKKASGLLLKALKNKLVHSVKTKGTVASVTFCSQHALKLTAGVQKTLKDGVTIRRTSQRLRNPKNAPDRLDRVALDFFAAQLKRSRKLPKFYLQNVPGPTRRYRYYRPLKTGALCLSCHGDPKTMPAPLKTVLQKLYPADKALGYKLGQLRGLVRVEMPEKLLGSDCCR